MKFVVNERFKVIVNVPNDSLSGVPQGGHLSIGTVAKLTGISVHTLRAWEKRHNVVEVVRSDTGRRLYSADDVQRLRLLKKLTSAGHSIGNVASLDNEELEGMLQLDFYDEPKEAFEKDRTEVCLFSDRGFEGMNLDIASTKFVDIVTKTSEIGELREALSAKRDYNVLFIFGNIAIHQLRMLRQLRESEPRHRFVVVFSSAQRDMIDEMTGLGFVLIRAPITLDKLFDKVIELDEHESEARTGEGSEVPPHRFTRRQLEMLSNYPSAIDCECPQHLASLIRSLTMFESYCQNCSSKNREDAYLHNEIYKMTAQARSTMEKAIAMVIEAENINLDYRTAES